jgi:hypothetical protein
LLSLGMDGTNEIVRFSREEGIELVLCGYTLSLPYPGPPDTGKGKGWPRIIESEPVRHLGPGVGPFAE